ncbi:uncharacterized protein BDV14DRAFT_199108 [Aspergillus stella-maris]|uniref:uncharacterized protein n=1 Tax=Aspergillus stella-maris TaxID=1810926 RepID=UPI003CCD8531
MASKPTVDLYISPLKFTDGPNRVWVLTLGPVEDGTSTFYYVFDQGFTHFKKYLDEEDPWESALQIQCAGARPVKLGSVSEDQRDDVINIADMAVKSDYIQGRVWPLVFGELLDEAGVLTVAKDVLEDAGHCECWGIDIPTYILMLCLQST